MRTYMKVYASNTVEQLVKLVLSLNTKAREEAITNSITYTLKMVAKINASDEDTYSIDGVNLSDVTIPSAFAWMIQPEAIRVIASKKYVNWRTVEDFLSSKSVTNTFQLSKWREGWDVLCSSLRLDASQVDVVPVESQRLKTITVTEESISRMVDSDSNTEPTFKFDVDPLFVKSHQMKGNYLISGFDDPWILEKFRTSLTELKSTHRQ